MKKLLGILAAGLMVLGLSSCNESWAWHQKTTVSVSTPSGVKTASSVMKAGIGEKGGWWAPPEATGASLSLSGEAVVLEVSPGKYLFALLTSMPRAYHVYFPHEPPLEVAGRLESQLGARELTRDQYPLLVTFSDINGPASVSRVDPQNLAASFGPGYALNAITMTITDEPVTEGKVERVLGWLGKYPEPKLSPATGRTTNIPFSRTVSHCDFIQR